MRLTVTSPIPNEATADLIVMPRCRSRASESVCVVPASTLPRLSITPAAYRSRSVSVVLPASTCARIPRLSVVRGTRHTLRRCLNGHHDGHGRLAHSYPPCSPPGCFGQSITAPAGNAPHFLHTGSWGRRLRG